MFRFTIRYSVNIAFDTHEIFIFIHPVNAKSLSDKLHHVIPAILWYSNTRILEYSNTRILEYSNTRILEYSNTLIHGLPAIACYWSLVLQNERIWRISYYSNIPTLRNHFMRNSGLILTQQFLTSFYALWTHCDEISKKIDLPGGGGKRGGECCIHFSNNKSWKIRDMNIFIFV